MSSQRRVWAVCAGVYLAALLAGLAVGWLAWELEPLWMILAADLAATLVVFVFSRIFGNTSLYDPYWSLAPPVIVLAWLLHPEAPGEWLRGGVILFLVSLWSARLTWNCLRRWKSLDQEDWRYVLLKERFGGGAASFAVDLAALHLLPTLFVWLALTPVWAAVMRAEAGLGVLDILAALVTFGAIGLEHVADQQLWRFRRGAGQAGRRCREGLWRYLRYPNYAGEQLFWCGLFLFCLAGAPGWWVTIIGPAAMVGLFQFGSIPLMKTRLRERGRDTIS